MKERIFKAGYSRNREQNLGGVVFLCKWKDTNIFQSLFEHTVIQIRQHQTKGVRNTGEVLIERTWKESKEINLLGYSLSRYFIGVCL